MAKECKLDASSDPKPWSLREELDNKEEKSKVKKITDTLVDRPFI